MKVLENNAEEIRKNKKWDRHEKMVGKKTIRY